MNQLSFIDNPPRWDPIFDDLSPVIVQEFFKFHVENPEVFELFKKYSEQARDAGREHFGSDAIVQRIRWFTSVETNDPDFKINNNHGSCYARLLMIEDKSFAGFFATRHTPGTLE